MISTRRTLNEQARHKDWEETSSLAKQTTSYVPSAKEFREIEVENNKLKNILGEKLFSPLIELEKKFDNVRMLIRG